MIRRVAVCAEVGSRHEADALLNNESAVVVRRGRPRSLVLKCPDGCGDTLTINLDDRAGKAWRLYAPSNGVFSLYPSVWRDDGCRAHFIIWNSTIYLLDRNDSPALPRATNTEHKILNALSDRPLSLDDLLSAIGGNPWEVRIACDALQHQRKISATRTNNQTVYQLVTDPHR